MPEAVGKIESCQNSRLAKGTFVVSLLSSIESAGHRVVYLRNYENLPNDIGNDVDILVELGHAKSVVELIHAVSPQYGWHFWKSVPFSSRSVFILNPDRCESLHVDISETIEWHCLPYADTAGIFARRQWNGNVNIPSTIDEMYLNLTTRLLYQGVVREKHRDQWRTALPSIDRAAFGRHVASQLSSPVSETYSQDLFAESWDDVEKLAGKLRKGVMGHCLTKRLRETFGRVLAFAFRQFRRLACPPGLFIAFEGVDGVGKRALMDRIMPALSELGSLSPPMVFHWKPSRRSIRIGGREEPRNEDIHSKPSCHPLGGLLILFFHWFGFWWGYLRYVLPQRARNRVVVADSYAYGVLLVPVQYRLSLPEWLLKLFCATVPRPDVVVALVADVERILERKQGRSREEVGRCQDKIKSLAHPAVRVVEANEAPDHIVRAVLAVLYREIVGR